MIKLIRTSDTNWNDRVSTPLKVTKHGCEFDGLVKTAGAVLSKEFAELQPSEKYAWVHTLAIGDYEKFGCNRNGDGFEGKWLDSNHHYFTKRANLFRNHQNKDPKKAIGIIKHSAYNPEMGRVELIVGYDKKLASDIVEKLANGEDVAGSMGTRVEFDTCTICGHKSPSPKTYCHHLKNAMCQVLDDGRSVGCLNPDPIFFDWSYVGRPADRIAFGFHSKVASDGAWVSSVDLANEAGLWLPRDFALAENQYRRQLKIAILGKLSEMEKEVPAKLTPIDTKIKDSSEGSGLDDVTADKLKKCDLCETMGALHSAQVLLPVKDFIKLISNKKDEDLGDIGDDVQSALPGVFGRMQDDEDTSALDNGVFDGVGEAGGPLKEVISRLIPSLGFGAEPLGQRMTITIIRGPRKHAAARDPKPLPEIETLARLYATYKLAALSHPRNEREVMLTRAALLQNYHHL